MFLFMLQMIHNTLISKSSELQYFQISVLKGNVNGIETCIRKGKCYIIVGNIFLAYISYEFQPESRLLNFSE